MACSRKGLTPNTGERDGNLEGIPSEQTNSQEIGLKFDVFERKLSGTVSVYRIIRENAIWEFSKAPVPVNWVGGVDPEGYTPDPATSFDPAKIASGEQPISYDIDNRYFINDGVDLGPITKIITDPDHREQGNGSLRFPPVCWAWTAISSSWITPIWMSR